jgi:hypothetical protein
MRLALYGRSFRGRCWRAAAVTVGVVLTQTVLFGPSLCGRKVLLPLDILTMPGWYLPPLPAYEGVIPHDGTQSDPVLQYEPMRRFVAAELRAGRAPLWVPYHYCGAPCAAVPAYSIFNLPYYLLPTPYVLAWIQLAKSLVAGWGAYLFFRKVLGAGFWPAAVGAWCYPVTGYFILWQGHYLSYTTALYPWLLLAVDRVIRRPASGWGPGLVVVTAVLLTVGAPDVAGLALLAAGLFAVWRLALRYGRRRQWRSLAAAGAALAAGWTLGFLLATPALLPLAEYVRTGARMQHRGSGTEERPPVGLQALPQTVLPLSYGTGEDGGAYLLAGNLQESAAAGYAGLLAALVLAPLGWRSRRYRAFNLFWSVLVVLALAWVLDLPVLVRLLRVPGLNLFSFNRFTFAAAFAVVAMAVAGLDVLRRGIPAPRVWYAVPAALLLLAAGWCIDSAATPPGPYAKLEESARRLRNPEPALAQVRRIRRRLQSDQLVGAGWCVAGLLLWAGLAWRRGPRWLLPLAGAAWTAEVLVFAWGRNAQCEAALYYPRVGALEKLAGLTPPGRILGLRCLPPLLGESYGLRDVRGYDAVDPLRLVELLNAVKDTQFPTAPYAELQEYVPVMIPGPGGKEGRLPPVLSMLNVRYVVGMRLQLKQMQPLLEPDSYAVWKNPDVLPRAFVPTTVRRAPAPKELLRLLGSPKFDPGAVAYTDEPPQLSGTAQGKAEVLDEIPTRLTLRADMKTPGLVVLSDLWYEGWEATVDGRAVPVLRVNHALRGVAVPAGTVFIEFNYRPKGFYLGLRLLAVALGATGLWTAVGTACGLVRRRKAGLTRPNDGTPAPGPVKPAVAGQQERTSPRGRRARRRRGFPG